ncbi:14313_t:CDS:2 [Cetraspora pellucida]|uniref:14313_t:CDS:1 n=1 Tax=Cetraspora pellucida TaxID=1433469 RepID=A0ACA9KHG4_9GLOM|nr:14313_t:CDS:2 [Cetraspora pellucida]
MPTEPIKIEKINEEIFKDKIIEELRKNKQEKTIGKLVNKGAERLGKAGVFLSNEISKIEEKPDGGSNKFSKIVKGIDKVKKQVDKGKDLMAVTIEKDKIEIFKIGHSNYAFLPYESRVSGYELYLFVYEPKVGEMEEILEQIKISEYSSNEYDKLEQKIREIKERLESDNPILAVHKYILRNLIKKSVKGLKKDLSLKNLINYESEYILNILENLKSNLKHPLVKEIEWNIEDKHIEYPDRYIKPYDIIKRKIVGGGEELKIDTLTYHFGVYLGENKVANIDIKEGVKITDLECFLKDEKELIVYHYIIPFKHPKLIREHALTAKENKYGKGGYDLFGKNCEHFASLCVCGTSLSEQVEKISKKIINYSFLEDDEEVRRFVASDLKSIIKRLIDANLEESSAEDLKPVIDQLIDKELEIEQRGLNDQRNQEIRKQIIDILFTIFYHVSLDNEIKNNKDHFQRELEENLKNNPNQALVINEVLFYAVRLFEYNHNTEKLDKLKKFPDDTKFSGYSTFEKAQQKVNEILANDQTIVSVIPLETNKNLVIIINRAFRHAVRLLEYNPDTQELTELRKSPKNTQTKGYSLEQALKKADEIKDEQELICLREKYRDQVFNDNNESKQNAGLILEDANVAKWLANKGCTYERAAGNIEELKLEYQAKALSKVLDIKLEEASGSIINPDKKVAEKNIKNILLIGRTGDGKSAIANVICYGGKEEEFPESDHGVSKTKDFEIKEVVTKDGISYRVIDTPGIGDTRLSFGEVLEKIVKAVKEVNYRLDHILFVTKGRITREEIETFNLLKTIIFDEEVVNHTILIRNGFSAFEDG